MNLLSSALFTRGSKAQLMENMTAALPFMDEDMRPPLQSAPYRKFPPLTENE